MTEGRMEGLSSVCTLEMSGKNGKEGVNRKRRRDQRSVIIGAEKCSCGYVLSHINVCAGVRGIR